MVRPVFRVVAELREFLILGLILASLRSVVCSWITLTASMPCKGAPSRLHHAPDSATKRRHLSPKVIDKPWFADCSVAERWGRAPRCRVRRSAADHHPEPEQQRGPGASHCTSTSTLWTGTRTPSWNGCLALGHGRATSGRRATSNGTSLRTLRATSSASCSGGLTPDPAPPTRRTSPGSRVVLKSGEEPQDAFPVAQCRQDSGINIPHGRTFTTYREEPLSLPWQLPVR